MTIDDLIAGCLAGTGGGRATLTLDPRFQGLPDTAHGGSVLAVFDAVAGRAGGREVLGVYRRRVPLGTPLALEVARDAGAARLALLDGRATLVDGRVGPVDDAPVEAAAPAGPTHPLPVSHACFACGTRNAIGLRVALEHDDRAVVGECLPPPRFARSDGTLAPVALTTLLDEAAFWLGALAAGEAGMTTEIRVHLHRPAAAGARLTVSGLRGRVARRVDDPRYWHTESAIHDERGGPIASARITFVAVRGAAKRLVAGMLAMNPPEVVRRAFPAYARA